MKLIAHQDLLKAITKILADYLQILAVIASLGVTVFFGVNNKRLKADIKDNNKIIQKWEDSVKVLDQKLVESDGRVDDLKNLYDELSNQEIQVDTFISNDTALLEWFFSRFGNGPH